MNRGNQEPDIGDVQRLQRVERKVLLASSALASNSRVAEGLLDHWQCFDAPNDSRYEKSRSTIASYIANMHIYQQGLKLLLDLLRSTYNLVSTS